MKSFRLLIALLFLSFTSVAKDSVFSMLPFEGKIKLKNIGLHISEDGKKMVNILQSNDYRKLVVVDPAGNLLQQLYFRFAGENEGEISIKKPTADAYITIAPSLSEKMTEASLHSFITETNFTEVFTDRFRSFTVVRTALADGIIQTSGIELEDQEFVLTSFTKDRVFYLLSMKKNSPELTLYKNDETNGTVIMKASADFSTLIKEGVVTDKQAKSMNKLLPLMFMRDEPMLHYNSVSASGQFLPFEQNTSPVKYILGSETLTMIAPANNGHFMEMQIRLSSGETKLKAIYTDRKTGDALLASINSNYKIIDEVVLSTTVKTIAVTDSLLICGRTKRGSVVLMYYSRTNGTLKNIDIISSQNIDQLNPMPASYMVTRTAGEPIDKELFLKQASADLSPMAINIIPSTNGELAVTIEMMNGRIKFADIAGALVEAAVFSIPASSLASAFLIGASSSVAGSLVGGALSTLSNSQMQFTTRIVNANTFTYVNNTIPEHPDFETARRIQSYLELPEIKSTELMALSQHNGAIYLSTYDKQSRMYRITKF